MFAHFDYLNIPFTICSLTLFRVCGNMCVYVSDFQMGAGWVGRYLFATHF